MTVNIDISALMKNILSRMLILAALLLFTTCADERTEAVYEDIDYVLDYEKLITYDVVIVGGGTGGMGAAYALKDTDFSVAVIESATSLGGTATNGWVETWIPGFVPSHMEYIFNEMKISGDISYDISQLHRNPLIARADKVSESILIPREELKAQYLSDLEDKVDLLMNMRFLAVAQRAGTKILSIYVVDNNTRKLLKIEADFFIEATGTGALCTSSNPKAGSDYFYGREMRDEYEKKMAMYPIDLKVYMNEPSLFFKIKKGYDDSESLGTCTSVYIDSKGKIVKPNYITFDGYPTNGIVNPMTGMDATGKDGHSIVLYGVDNMYREYRDKRLVEYWKYIKLSLQKAYEDNGNVDKFIGGWNTRYREWGFAGETAEMLGVREGVRINCDYMLTLPDLEKAISAYGPADFIAVGSHNVDIHVTNGLNGYMLKEFNQTKLKVYGIPYGCLIPKRLDNVLIASRCYGASQMALASGRTNLTIAQLGWAAGNAVKICLESGYTNVRAVDVNLLQSGQYTGLSSKLRTFL